MGREKKLHNLECGNTTKEKWAVSIIFEIWYCFRFDEYPASVIHDSPLHMETQSLSLLHLVKQLINLIIVSQNQFFWLIIASGT